ncbi:unnamed protein product [Paramecium octaurelia]|uniref:Uncharacterized protein n=1 Tax=Paramecium octaurelia TaxID=43137 RepID=A0A8S1YK89_PAROT|nr:unnamed protein product [Paramecium octaurelia]
MNIQIAQMSLYKLKDIYLSNELKVCVNYGYASYTQVGQKYVAVIFMSSQIPDKLDKAKIWREKYILLFITQKLLDHIEFYCMKKNEQVNKYFMFYQSTQVYLFKVIYNFTKDYEANFIKRRQNSQKFTKINSFKYITIQYMQQFNYFALLKLQLISFLIQSCKFFQTKRIQFKQNFQTLLYFYEKYFDNIQYGLYQISLYTIKSILTLINILILS